MTKHRLSALVVVGSLLFGLPMATFSQEASKKKKTRIAWTTSKVVGSPEPPLPYTTERAFPKLKFKQCLDMTQPAGSQRMFIAEQSGKIYSFINREDTSQADLVIDLRKAVPGVVSLYAIAFHPDFARNRYCYVCYIKAANLKDGTHIARFRVSESTPPTIDASTEETVITWLSGGHNGSCLKFGPDGYLYVSTGDGAPANPPDIHRAGQDVSNLLSAVLRIDVDKKDGNRNYAIPQDNPFIDLPQARGEIWAYGFRNPWRMSFDSKTGDLWVGDVGWELWEMLDRVERGGNYGWGVMEGRQSTNPEWPRGPTPILPPTIDHPHSESSSITDGLTYYGDRLTELNGHHLYADYDTGKFWAFRYDGKGVVDHREIADTTHRVVGFATGNDGEFYIIDHAAGTLHRLVPNPKQNNSSEFPRRLSETGLFSSVKQQQPAAGVVPFQINAELWADHATAQRFVGIPGTGVANPTAAAWSLPKNSVFAKTLSLQMRHGVPSSLRHVETQLLHFDGETWQPYTYRWNDDQTDATLVAAAGAEQTFEVADPRSPAGKRVQVWRFAGRAECQRCHNRWSGPPLGFQTAQLNRKLAANGEAGSQLDTFAELGLIANPIDEQQRPQLARLDDGAADIDSKARAYLHVNCGHCHRMHAGSAVLSYLHHDLPLDKTNLVGARPSQGTFGIPFPAVVAAGDPFRSVLLYRMAKLGAGRMPHIGSTEVDRAGVALIEKWIRQLQPAKQTQSIPAALQARAQADKALKDLTLATEERQEQLVEQLLKSTSSAMMLLQSIDGKTLKQAARATVVKRATAHEDTRIRDLFERFLPPSQRVRRLGAAVQPQQILSLSGDALRGRNVFFNTAGVACKNCHRIKNEGKSVGPDLTAIGRKLNRGQLLESILEPSKRIDPKFVTYLVETEEGQLVTGLLVRKNDVEVVLRNAKNEEIRLPKQHVEQLVPQRKSLMPELLVRDLTAQQVADLLVFLSSLRDVKTKD